jgi:Cu2+-exporting ATPase
MTSHVILDQSAVSQADSSYTFLSNEEYISKNVCKPCGDDNFRVEFYVAGITCYGCVWLIKKSLQKQFKRVEFNINQSQRTLTLVYGRDAEVSLQEIAKFVHRLGYPVSLSPAGLNAKLRDDITRLGVAIFVALNVMSFALAEYFGGEGAIEPKLQFLFRTVSALLTLLALIYSGKSFFLNSWNSLRYGNISIDAPILLGLLAVFFWSVLNIISGQGEVYFDSISAVVALVLTGRFLLARVQLKVNQSIQQLLSPTSAMVSRIAPISQTISINDIKAGDILRIIPSEVVPVESEIVAVSGATQFSDMEITGEPFWYSRNVGDVISSGAIVGGSSVELKAIESGSQSYVSRMGALVERLASEKSKLSEFADRVAPYFLGVVISLAGTTLLICHYTHIPLQHAIERMAAVLLVACPCTFGTGVPLITSLVLVYALKRGILFKSGRSIETLGKTKHFIFDKTGTLTDDSLAVEKVCSLNGEYLDDQHLDVLAVLSEYSNHSVIKAIAAWAVSQTKVDHHSVIGAEESLGKGLTVSTSLGTYLLGSKQFIFHRDVEHEDGTWLKVPSGALYKIYFREALKSEASATIELLRARKVKFSILSGDGAERVESVASTLQITTLTSTVSPAGKLSHLRQTAKKQNVAMVGNGFNDSGAMTAASVSIAVDNASTAAKNAADICLLKDSLKLIPRAFDIARASTRATVAILMVSGLYNTVGIALAMSGYMKPLLAAVLMPLSSLSVTAIAMNWRIFMKSAEIK